MFFISRIAYAVKGKKIWKKIRSDYLKGKEDVFVIMLPEKNDELNYEIIKQLTEYMERKSFNQSVVIGDREDEWIYNRLNQDSRIYFKALESHQMECLSAYYRLHWFYDKFNYAAINLPYGNTDGNMLLSSKIDIKGIVKGSIFC